MTSRALTFLLCTVIGVAMLCIGGLLGLSGAAVACASQTASPITASAPPSANGTASVSTRTSPVDPGQCFGVCSLADGSSATAGCEAGTAVLARAATWLTAWNGDPVPYLSSTDPSTWFDGYRRDCSGYVSMALGLPGPGLDTAALAARSTPIPKTELLPGDLLINPAPDLAGHVVIFDRWTDATLTSYLGYEQSGDGGTHHRVIPYPYFGDYLLNPYRR